MRAKTRLQPVLNNVRRSTAAGAALIVLLTVATYLPTLRCGFVLDDEVLITENPMIKASDGLYRSWLTTEPTQYHPLTWSLWWLEWRLWGNHATGYHVVNVLLHAVDAVLVWIVLRRLKIPGAWLAALVFAVHPVNVATVAWISEQKNMLSMLFFAVTILLYLQFDEEERSERRWPRSERRWPRSERGKYGLALGAFLLALLSKAAVVMLPVVLLGCVWWIRGKVRWKDFLCTAPFFVLSTLLGLAAVWFVNHRAMEGQIFRTVGLAARLAAAVRMPWFYLYKALVPVHLTVVYPKWETDASRWVSYLPGVALVGCFALFWWKRQTWGRPLLFGLGYFMVTLFPVLGFFDQPFYQFTWVADHWQYYPIVGVIALAVAGGQRICHRIGQRSRSVDVLLGAILLAVLAVAAWRRSLVYVDAETLWRDNVAREPSAWVAHNNLGGAYLRAGKVEEAIQQFDLTLQINPDYPVAYYNLGGAWKRLGRLPEAIEYYQRAVQVRPDYAEAQNNLGVTLGQVGDLAGAIEHLEQAVRIKPDFAEARYNLAVALELAGRIPDAIGHLEEVVRIKPDFPGAQDRLASLRAGQARLRALP